MDHSLENLKPLIRCPVCQKKYEPEQVLLLSEEEGKLVFHLACEDCSVSSIIFLSLGRMGAVSYGLLTDLTREEVKKFYGRAPVSVDETLEVHRFLKRFRGGIDECLSR